MTGLQADLGVFLCRPTGAVDSPAKTMLCLSNRSVILPSKEEDMP